MLDAGKGGPHIGSAILRGGGNSQGKQKESKTVSHFKPLQNQNGRPWQRYQVGSCYEAFPLPGRSFRRRFDRRRRELRMIITAAHVIRAMIPAMRELGKKMAAIHATKNETQPAASMVSFRILVERRERNGDISPLILTRMAIQPRFVR
jgi:hypothetical protein